MKFGRLGSEKNNKKEAQKRERGLAKRFGGKATPNSGAIEGFRGDVILDKYLVEDKFTNQKGYSLKLETLSKITKEAYEANREPLFIVEFRQGIKHGNPKEWALIPKKLFNEEIADLIEVRNKSTFLSVQILNTFYSQCLKDDKNIAREMKFYGVPLGVSASWILTPLKELEDNGYFE